MGQLGCRQGREVGVNGDLGQRKEMGVRGAGTGKEDGKEGSSCDREGRELGHRTGKGVGIEGREMGRRRVLEEK